MSMLSAQCDELRSMAESVGLAMPQAATLMMEAADAIWELRGSVHRERSEADRLRELATYALKHIIEVECEAPDRERFRGKPCEDCVEYGSSDCPKCMPRMFGVSGIEVD